MQPIIIGSAEVAQEIAQGLASQFDGDEPGQPQVEIRDSHRGNYRFFECRLLPQGDSHDPSERVAVFRDTLAAVIARVVVDGFEQRLIRRIIGDHYAYFGAEEQELLAGRASRRMAGEGVHRRRFPHVHAKLQEYLQQSNDFVLEGFVTFRMREYIDEVEAAVDQAVDDFLVEREYREFIRLLKHFVDVQEPRVADVHVVLGPQRTFELIDAHGRAIQDQYIEGFAAELADGDVDREDFLISALITVAPSRVTLHGHQVGDLAGWVDTIESVFAERVGRCAGCALCQGARRQGAVLSSP